MHPRGEFPPMAGVPSGGATQVPQAYIPFMLSVKGQLKTVEMSLLRYDSSNMFLSKPESAPPIEKNWRVTPLRWSAEREPFCVLTHRETNRLRLVVAKPDAACEMWPVMYSSDKPDGGITNCSVSPSRCKFVSFMWNSGLYLIGMDRSDGNGSVFQVNAPQEPWVCVRDKIGQEEWGGSRDTRLTPFYHLSEGKTQPDTFFLVQEKTSAEGVTVRRVVDPLQPWHTLPVASGYPPACAKVQFLYLRRPASSEDWPIEVFATWIDGCSLYLSFIPSPNEPWELIHTVPIPPHSRLGTMYVPFLSEPLVVSTSMDPNYVGSVAVRRMYLSEWYMARMRMPQAVGQELSPPRVIRYMQVPALPIAPRDLTSDLPITDLPYRDFMGEFVGKRLMYDLTPPNIPILPPIPPPPIAPQHAPVGLVLTSSVGGGSVMAGLVGKSRLDWIPSPAALDEYSNKWKITPLRWAPGREVLFVIMQSPELRATRIAIAAPDKACGEWATQIEFPDASVPFSECVMVPFQYQTVPGNSDLFVFVLHQGTGKGGLFFIANPRTEWQFIREIAGEEASQLLDKDSRVSVMYHRSKDPASVNLCTFFVVTKKGEETRVRVMVEPNQPTFDVTPKQGFGPIAQADDIRILYAFSPKPPVTHVWPCEVFVAYVEEDELVVAHVPAPDSPWRKMYSQQVPAGSRISPVYLPYLAEPLLLNVVDGIGNRTMVDLLRLNLIEAYSTGPEDTTRSRFVHRYQISDNEGARLPKMAIADTTLDTALVWIPQMGAQGMHPYSGYPLPFEKRQDGKH